MTSELFCSVGCEYPLVLLLDRKAVKDLGTRLSSVCYGYDTWHTVLLKSFLFLQTLGVFRSQTLSSFLLLAVQNFSFPFVSGESLGTRLLTCSIAKNNKVALLRHFVQTEARTSTSKWQKYTNAFCIVCSILKSQAVLGL